MIIRRHKPELWRAVPGYERYAVSSRGRVKVAVPYSHRPDLLNHILTVKTEKRYRYIYVDLYGANGKSKRFYVHVLVMLAFKGPKPAGLEVRHLDGTRTNNVLENLKYGTRSENVQDAIKHGTFTQRGVRKHTAESLRKISEASKYMNRSEEELNRVRKQALIMAESNKGKKQSAEHIAKRVASWKITKEANK